MTETFKLTYATMFNPPEELHTRFEEALAKIKANLGQEVYMLALPEFQSSAYLLLTLYAEINSTLNEIKTVDSSGIAGPSRTFRLPI